MGKSLCTSMENIFTEFLCHLDTPSRLNNIKKKAKDLTITPELANYKPRLLASKANTSCKPWAHCSRSGLSD